MDKRREIEKIRKRKHCTSCLSTEMWSFAGLKKAVPSTSLSKHQKASTSLSRAARRGASRSVIPASGMEGGREGVGGWVSK